MTRAVLSIGSNVGDRPQYLQAAVDAFRPWLAAVSPVYETAPWGPVAQPDYLNAVLIVEDPSATAHDWLRRGQETETAAGRERSVRWGARTLDVDVIDVDHCASDDTALTLPHPRASSRAFVLVPWHAVDPGAVLASSRVGDLIAHLDPHEVAGVRQRPDVVLR